ncbi:haloalkane dehalogenase [Paludibaculum fermentans]|uniref:haloalkane dehalogenase n=1 Tax=Paludibaculum fermentans TaxID=1473598 RepID=UPI003EB891F4
MKKVSVLGSAMAYQEAGEGKQPVAVFLHGNPTSSYIWRNVIPAVAPVARCIAPDLIGFGQSDKPAISYRFEDHVRYLDCFLETLGLDSFYLVAQDWGSALAFHFAARFPQRVRGLAFLEFIRPMPTWNDFNPSSESQAIFRDFRTPGVGEKMILEENFFVEGVLPNGVHRTLTEEERQAYRAPFPTPQSRIPAWRFPNELPIAGEPPDVWAVMETAHSALAQSLYPKLLFAGNPGALVPPEFAERFASRLTNCRLVHLGPGRHYLQEDHPETIGCETAQWIAACEQAAPRQQRHAAAQS